MNKKLSHITHLTSHIYIHIYIADLKSFMNNPEAIRDYCLSFKGVTEETPFGPEVVVYKVMGKIFAMLSLDENRRISLKNTPEKNAQLRADYSFIEGAYHMNKKHWSMVNYADNPDGNLLKNLITDSYDLVIAKLPNTLKNQLSLM